MSSTSTKRDITDFLWEWTSSFGDWSKLLVSLVVQKESNLTKQEREKVFDHFLGAIDLKSGLSALDITKPKYSPSSSYLTLTSLSEINGVNRLAKGQEIIFSKNLTVIYGMNGSGKTGYGRILKALGFSYIKDNVIYSDISKKPESQSALLKYESEGKEFPFRWDGKSSNQELHNICFFNNDCVSFSLTEDRDLIVSPIGFHLFNIISSELDSLTRMLDSYSRDYPTDILWKDMLSKGTPQFELIQSLSPDSRETKLVELSTFTDDNKKQLDEKVEDLKNLNPALIKNEISNYKLQIDELTNIISEVTSAKKVLNSNVWEEIKSENKQLLNLENTSKISLREIAETRGIEFYDSTEFLDFLKSADALIKKINDANFPDSDGSVCLYCRHLLDEEAKILLSSYKKMLNDTTQDQIKLIKQRREYLISELSLVGASLEFHQRTFGVNEDGSIIQPTIMCDYNEKMKNLKQQILEQNVDESTNFDIDYDCIVGFLESKKSELEKLHSDKTSLLTNIKVKENELTIEINELKDRKFLSTKVEEVKKVIKNKKMVYKLNQSRSFLNTMSISRKTSEAREELIKQNFTEKFNEELQALRKSQINIDLDFGTAKGQSRIQQKMNSNYLLKDILSEGEQKAIALAEFLTELQLDNSKSPVVFDDPVSSLDHDMIDELAKRLTKLSGERQVIVFTHSILLFNSIMQNSKLSINKNIEHKYYNLKSEYGQCGLVSEILDEINSVNSCITEINKIINNSSKSLSESALASDGYGYLRAAIELFVEVEILGGTVRRYKKNVALTNFIRVDGNLINKHKEKLNEIFERCCGFIKGHSNPIEIHREPTLEELKTDFEIFKTIRKEFVKII